MTDSRPGRCRILSVFRWRRGKFKLEAGIGKLESREEKISTRKGVGVVHRLWCLSLEGEARGVSQRLLPGVRGGAASSTGADVRRGAHFLDPDPAGGILETLGLHGVWARSACQREDAARV